MRFHCKCINVQAEEYNFFMESGTSKYKCNQCMKRRDPSTAELISEAGIAVTPTEGSAACLDSADAVYGNSSESVIQLFQSIASRLDELTREVRELRVENSSLRDEVRDLRDCVCGKVEFPALPKGSDCPAPSTGSFASVVMTDPRASRAGVPPPKFHARQKSPVRHQRTVVHRSSDPERQTQRPPTTVGTAKQSVLKTAPRPSAEPGLFVSRLAPSTEASDVQELLAGLVGDKTVMCTKLKTRYPTYSSFHVSLDKDLFELLNKPEVWPNGCVFRPFYGKLSPLRHFEASSTVQATPNNGAEN